MTTRDLTKEDVYQVLCQFFPKQNDFGVSDYSEELQELTIFGIHSPTALENLLRKHKDEVMKIDAEPLDDFLIKTYKKEYGEKYIQNKIQNKFWYAFPALLRTVLELEFGKDYVEFANRRDNI